MKKWMKSGLAVSLIAVMMTGCSGASAAYSTSSGKTEAAPATANVSNGNIEYAFTQAGEHPEKLLVKQIDSATSTLDVAIYSLTQPDIVNSIIKASQRGVKVRVITDKQESENKNQKEAITQLKVAKIPVKDNSHSGLMHLKVSIIDNKTCTTGSFNYTNSASRINDEVLVVLHDEKMTQDFEKQFERMWNDSKDFQNI